VHLALGVLCWLVLGVPGALLLFGLCAAILLALALIAGINLLLLGTMSLVDSFSGDSDTTSRVLAAVLGLLGIMAGLVVMRRPGESLLAVLIVLGIWFVITGLVDLVRAVVVPGERAWRMVAALADIVLGGLILALPGLSLGTLAVLIALAFLVRGAFAIVRGFQLRRAADQAAPA
jgi:uncharacterized membrane protein HdeD (DUF308 family)